MSGVDKITVDTSGGIVAGGIVGQFLPEPKSSISRTFSSVLGGVSSALGIGGGLDPTYQALIEQQQRAQEQMLVVSLYSNNLKSDYETKMAAVRNVRVG